MVFSTADPWGAAFRMNLRAVLERGLESQTPFNLTDSDEVPGGLE